MKVDSLYEETQNNVLTLHGLQNGPYTARQFNLNIETTKYFSDPTPPPKQPNTARNSNNDNKIGVIKNASQMHAQKMKVDRLYKEIPKSFLTIT